MYENCNNILVAIFGRNLKVFRSIFLHETPQTVRYMSVVYQYWSISVYVEYFWLQSQSSN